jgi:hypothetical protein
MIEAEPQAILSRSKRLCHPFKEDLVLLVSYPDGVVNEPVLRVVPDTNKGPER